MKRQTAKWVGKAEQDWEAAHKLASAKPLSRDIVCFHCQQAAEKYVKALLQENGLVVPRTHDIASVLGLLVPSDGSLSRLRRRADSLTRYAVAYRYPGVTASKRKMQAALRHVECRSASEIRGRLSLPP